MVVQLDFLVSFLIENFWDSHKAFRALLQIQPGGSTSVSWLTFPL